MNIDNQDTVLSRYPISRAPPYVHTYNLVRSARRCSRGSIQTRSMYVLMFSSRPLRLAGHASWTASLELLSLSLSLPLSSFMHSCPQGPRPPAPSPSPSSQMRTRSPSYSHPLHPMRTTDPLALSLALSLSPQLLRSATCSGSPPTHAIHCQPHASYQCHSQSPRGQCHSISTSGFSYVARCGRGFFRTVTVYTAPTSTQHQNPRHSPGTRRTKPRLPVYSYCLRTNPSNIHHQYRSRSDRREASATIEPSGLRSQPAHMPVLF